MEGQKKPPAFADLLLLHANFLLWEEDKVCLDPATIFPWVFVVVAPIKMSIGGP